MRAMVLAAQAGGMDTADWDPDGPMPGHNPGLETGLIFDQDLAAWS
jgi:hypothetical protein